MRFVGLNNPGNQDLGLPEVNTAIDATTGLSFQAWVGLPHWGREVVTNFYPRSISNELAYYANQFNSVELDVSSVLEFLPSQCELWRDSTPEDFRFFPKLKWENAHSAKAIEAGSKADILMKDEGPLADRLGVGFLQMADGLGPELFGSVKTFIEAWSYDVPLAIEFRSKGWHDNGKLSEDLYGLMEDHGVANILIDTAGRRDLLHMRLTTPTAFIRFVGANHPVDYKRLDDWVDRIAEWKKEGLRELYFFIHQHVPKELVELSAHFIGRLNEACGTNMPVPRLLT